MIGSQSSQLNSGQYRYALPVNYSFQQGYKIIQVLYEDEFSISYLATDIDQKIEVALIEYFPRFLSQRDQVSYNILPITIANNQNYQWGLSQYRDTTYELLGVNHPNVIKVKTFFEAHNTLYKVMETIKGVCLDSFLNNKTLSETETIAFITPLLEGLQTIHSAGRIHSGLSPSTILIPNDISKPIIAHLGDAKYHFWDYKTEIAQLVSPGYSSGEQYFANDKQGAWTDIYALGGILYYLISGVTPDSAAARLTGFADNNKDPLVPAVRKRQGGNTDRYSDQLLAAIDHAMQIQRVDRPQSIEEWRDELGIRTGNTDKLADKSQSNLSNTRQLSIDGVALSCVFESRLPERKGAVDFSAISQLPFEKSKPSWRRYGLTVTAVLISFILSYYYFTQPQVELELTKTTDGSPVSLHDEVIHSSIEASSLGRDTVGEPLQIEASFDEVLLTESPLDTSLPEVKITPLSLLDVPIDKDNIIVQHLTNTPVLLVRKIFSKSMKNRNIPDKEVGSHEAFSLKTIIKRNNQEPYLMSKVALVSDGELENTTNKNNQEKRSDSKNRNVKTREQYIKEWAAKQKQKHANRQSKKQTKRQLQRKLKRSSKKQPQKKTKKQYQQEWEAKQRQLKKRAEWKKRKQQLEEKKKKQTTQQVEKQLLNENDW